MRAAGKFSKRLHARHDARDLNKEGALSRPQIFLLCVLGVAALSAERVRAQEAADFFQQNCMSCHTIGGGRLIGPDLKDVAARQDRRWLLEFMSDPRAMITAGDPYALKLQQESRGMVMPKVAGLDHERAEALLDLIKIESEKPDSRFKGVEVGEQPFTAADIAQGRAIFLGVQRLTNGGPACVSCHTVSGLPGLGGGRLGPDLSKVYERLQGRKNVSAWLFAPATITMQPIFKAHPLTSDEILQLVALFESSAQGDAQEANSVGLVYFFLLALGGTCLGLVFFETAWKHRLRTVRQALVQRSRRGVQR